MKRVVGSSFFCGLGAAAAAMLRKRERTEPRTTLNSSSTISLSFRNEKHPIKERQLVGLVWLGGSAAERRERPTSRRRNSFPFFFSSWIDGAAQFSSFIERRQNNQQFFPSFKQFHWLKGRVDWLIKERNGLLPLSLWNVVGYGLRPSAQPAIQSIHSLHWLSSCFAFFGLVKRRRIELIKEWRKRDWSWVCWAKNT